MADSDGPVDRLKRDRETRDQGEDDAPLNTTASAAGEHGGVDQPGTQDRNSSTGTTPNDETVGRSSGDETADVDESGGERRAGRQGEGDAHEGALRDT